MLELSFETWSRIFGNFIRMAVFNIQVEGIHSGHKCWYCRYWVGLRREKASGLRARAFAVSGPIVRTENAVRSDAFRDSVISLEGCRKMLKTRLFVSYY